MIDGNSREAPAARGGGVAPPPPVIPGAAGDPGPSSARPRAGRVLYASQTLGPEGAGEPLDWVPALASLGRDDSFFCCAEEELGSEKN